MLYRFIIIAASLVLLYIWIGYPIVLLFLSKFFSRRINRRVLDPSPRVSIIIAVRNEEKNVAAKLANCASLDYTQDRLEFLIVSDNSTDQTEEIVRNLASLDPRIRLLSASERQGKSGAQNLAVQNATGEILFFTDANTRTNPDVLKILIENFADPSVGLVTADVYFGQPGNPVASGQGLYWRFELFLRKLESELSILATGSGQLLIMRRALYKPIPVMYGDDCILPLDVRLQGYRVLQDARVIVFDSMPNSITGELRARVRMTARNWTGTLSRPAILNPLRFPVTFWGLISHKLLRWLTPFFLAVLLTANALSALQGKWTALFILQASFYVAAFIGWVRVRKGAPAWLFSYPFAFCLANVGFFLGMVKVLRRQRIIAY